MSVKIEDATSLGAGFCSVLNNSIQATGPQSAATAGFQMLGSEVNPAGVGVGRVTKEIEASEDYRLRVGVDTLLFQDGFFGTVLNSRNWAANTTTMTVTVGSGRLTLNAGANVGTATVANVASWTNFRVLGGAPTYWAWEYIYPPAAPVANNTFEMGPTIATGTSAPTDGACFRYTAAGTFLCVVNYNGTEVTSSALTAPATNVRHKCVISAYDDSVNFWIDDELVASIPTPTGNGQPFSAGSLPLRFRTYNAGSAPGQAVSPQIFAPSVSIGDMAGNNRPPSDTACGMGGMGISAQSGATVAQLTNYANSAAPASATLSNTAAGYTTPDGQWQFVAVGGAETDYCLFGFQVPVGAANLGNKKLVIRGVTISTNNTGAAVATTEHLLQWGLGIGASAVSLATADTATTKAYHRVALGTQVLPIAAAIGAEARTIQVTFAAPLVVNPGEFVAIILKMPRATATASQVIRGTAYLDKYWE